MMINLEIKCPFCGNVSEITVDKDGYDKYQNGELIQFAFPELDAETRETLINGMCKDCQDKFFPMEDEEDE